MDFHEELWNDPIAGGSRILGKLTVGRFLWIQRSGRDVGIQGISQGAKGAKGAEGSGHQEDRILIKEKVNMAQDS